MKPFTLKKINKKLQKQFLLMNNLIKRNKAIYKLNQPFKAFKSHKKNYRSIKKTVSLKKSNNYRKKSKSHNPNYKSNSKVNKKQSLNKKKLLKKK
jgi:hypothetical protein